MTQKVEGRVVRRRFDLCAACPDMRRWVTESSFRHAQTVGISGISGTLRSWHFLMGAWIMVEKVTHIRPVDSGGEPPDMEQRLRNLEQDVAVIKTTMSTKSDVSEIRVEVHSLLRQHIMWNVGSIIAMAGLVFAIMRFAGS
jgi:hypothetical protein